MPIQFPSNPTSGQTYTYNGIVYSWTGQNWRRTGANVAIAYDTATTSTGYFDLPSGTTAERPSSPPNGAIRQNTNTLQLEYYSNTYQSWMALQQVVGGAVATTFDIEYLVVAGGGAGGGAHAGGGGGAGGFRTASGISVAVGTNYTVTVGGGGSGASQAAGGQGTALYLIR